LLCIDSFEREANDTRWLLSKYNLTYFSGYTHRTWLDRLNLDAPMERAPARKNEKVAAWKR
jgi:hypothetical protein